MTLRDDLIAARALIDTPEKWTQEAFATSSGCLCAVGALEKHTDCHYRSLVVHTDALCAALPDELPAGLDEHRDWDDARDRAWIVMRFNDHPSTTHADILALFDRAIEAADGQ